MGLLVIRCCVSKFGQLYNGGANVEKAVGHRGGICVCCGLDRSVFKTECHNVAVAFVCIALSFFVVGIRAVGRKAKQIAQFICLKSSCMFFIAY